MKIETELCEKKLKSPLILGSGILGEKVENCIKALKNGAGAVVNRTLRLDPSDRKVYDPAYYFGDNYMLNTDNQNLRGWEYWKENLEKVEKVGPLIVSLTARHPEDCKIITREFERLENSPTFYEINFSCPHSAERHGEIQYGSVKDSLKKTRAETNQPVFLKMSLNNLSTPRVYTMMEDIEKKGMVDGYTFSNSIGPGIKVDIKERKPYLEAVYGGMSGKAIKPLVLYGLFELRKRTELPIMGVGGISSYKDVLEYILMGAQVVQIYTEAHLNGLKIFNQINKNLKKYLDNNQVKLDEIRGEAFEKARRMEGDE